MNTDTLKYVVVYRFASKAPRYCTALGGAGGGYVCSRLISSAQVHDLPGAARQVLDAIAPNLGERTTVSIGTVTVNASGRATALVASDYLVEDRDVTLQAEVELGALQATLGELMRRFPVGSPRQRKVARALDASYAAETSFRGLISDSNWNL